MYIALLLIFQNYCVFIDFVVDKRDAQAKNERIIFSLIVFVIFDGKEEEEEKWIFEQDLVNWFLSIIPSRKD